jgi:RND family efflux transporter MFP subunit
MQKKNPPVLLYRPFPRLRPAVVAALAGNGRKVRSRVAVVALTAGFLFSYPLSSEADPATPVEVARAVAADTAETLRLTGTVTAERRARLSPRVSGLVAAVRVDAGDRVEEGDVLLDLDRVLAELGLRRAEAAVDEARTRLTEAKRLQGEAKELVKDNYIPETDAHARTANVKLNAAVVARLEAEVHEAQERVARHSVVAPFAGVISRKLTEAGEWVETGVPVLELVGTDDLRLDVQAPQERFVDVDENTSVSVRLDGHPNRTFTGRVAAKVPVHDPGARTFLVRVLLEDADGWMIPGMSAAATFGISGERSAVTVPRDALVRDSDAIERVWIVEDVDGESRVSSRPVRIGRSLAETIEVVEGLEVDLPVVIRGNETLREGQVVQVLAEN